MKTKIEPSDRSVWKRFESYGFIGGTGLGLLVGILVTAPNFQKWAIDTSIWIILGSVAIGGLIGFFAPSIAAGSVANGSAYNDHQADVGHGSSGDAGGSDGGSSGGES